MKEQINGHRKTIKGLLSEEEIAMLAAFFGNQKEESFYDSADDSDYDSNSYETPDVGIDYDKNEYNNEIVYVDSNESLEIAGTDQS